MIVRNICQYAENQFPEKYDLIFVSNNTQDFIDKDTKEVYQSILEGLPETRFISVTDLGHALKLAPELIENYDDWIETMIDNMAMDQLDLIRGK